jgi:hypothetical protein
MGGVITVFLHCDMLVKRVSWFCGYDFLFILLFQYQYQYNYPIGVIEWKYQKQLLQVQKGVYQFVKISFTKKPTKTNLMDNFTMNTNCFCHFLLLLNFTT